jgi:hypothetical protein
VLQYFAAENGEIMHLRNLALTTALAISATALILPSAFAQDRDHPDYSKNKYYQMGNKEGMQDHHKNVQRTEHNHGFRNDDDRRAHDEGYKLGWGGQDYRVVISTHH